MFMTISISGYVIRNVLQSISGVLSQSFSVSTESCWRTYLKPGTPEKIAGSLSKGNRLLDPCSLFLFRFISRVTRSD